MDERFRRSRNMQDLEKATSGDLADRKRYLFGNRLTRSLEQIGAMEEYGAEGVVFQVTRKSLKTLAKLRGRSPEEIENDMEFGRQFQRELEQRDLEEVEGQVRKANRKMIQRNKLW